MLTKKILTIIVTFNGENWINSCIKSLNNSKIKTDIIVIDNKSTDNTVSIVQKFNNVKFIDNPLNLGFGQGNNIGLKRALNEKYDYAFLLNQDAKLDEETLNVLVKRSLVNPEFGIISAIHYNYEGKKLEENFANFIGRNSSQALLNDLFQQKLKNIYEIDFVNAACWLISKECIKRVGGFDPLFFHYVEDDDYCHRVKSHGFKIGIVTDAKVYHAVDNNKKQHKNNWAKIFSNKHRSYSYHVLNIKKSNGMFVKMVADEIITLISSFFHDLIARNIIGCLFRLYLAAKILYTTPKIYSSRKQSQRVGTSFL